MEETKETLTKRVRNVVAALERDGSLAPYTETEIHALHNLVQDAEHKFGAATPEKWASQEASDVICSILGFLRVNGAIVPEKAIDALGMFWLGECEYDAEAINE